MNKLTLKDARRLVLAHEIIDASVKRHDPSHLFALFSGGHDSLCATAVAAEHPSFTAAVHINTGIGVEQTREFVRETCEREGWPLIEMHPDDKTYDELVLDKGFPRGPQSHNTMYYYLKQRQVRRLVREHKEHYYDRIGLVTGIRKQESDRRMAQALSQMERREGAQLWINPVLHWSKRECNAFIRWRGLQRNEVADLIHKSGECLCGAFAHADDIEEIEAWFPESAERIHELERKAQDRGLVDCKWAARPKAPGKKAHDLTPEERAKLDDLPMCSDCVLVA